MDLDLYLRQLEELVNIDSGSKNADGINQVADRLQRWYEELGWNVESIHVGEETGRVLLITNHPSDHYDVMFVGHMDTVFPDGTAVERPFRIEGDNCYGPGVGDMKNGDVAMYHVAANLPKEALDRLNIAMVYNPDEEIGSRYSRDTLDAIGARADYIFVMESAGQNGTRHCFARKGSLGYEIEFHGKAAHSGFMFEVENASAVLEMGNYIVKLMGLASREEDTTVNVGIAGGGTAGNVVADYARLQVEMRFKKDSERDRLKQTVEDMVSGTPYVEGVRTEIVRARESAPFVKTEEAKRYIAHIRGLAEELGIPFAEKDRGGLSDANHLSRCGHAIVLDGMGPHGALDHSEKEYGYIGSVEPCVRLLVRILQELASSK
ncbi:MAG: M20 family metallopeptidase [Lachnospiraceae bacterium]|jgi:glutamate carboxypeptidase|nr:M20 family metallopeptidase [uncultured Acetatifactor sp.]MCI9570796.1 M20 family metallopeptidase [Lachnospiraceae bacterium]